ncbi:MAG TPA: protease pro-enzyme activation domain-containing protein, partial [Candidatus Sulfopaludibacter sp.]|nr:protease pro-enzyme activation domain-containing protein [Candidatus Sulfopaludibacter sp.]
MAQRHTLGAMFGGALMVGLASVRLAAQVPARVVRAVDDAQVVRLAGNTPPQLRAGADQGAAPADLPFQHILLVLRRSPAQAADLRQLLDAQRENDSPNFHQWLTPAQFGARFGPAPADLAAVTAWLARQGFQIDSVSPGEGVIEFSGTAGAVASGLHVEIHRYLVAGVAHWANAADPAIPAALAPVVAGIVSLNDFRKPPASHFA